MSVKTATSSNARARTTFYEQLASLNLAPLWETLGTLITPEPTTDCRPTIWRYAQVRDFLLESGALISAKEAIRRVLILENPGMPGQARITSSLFAGLQLVQPGEMAPAHRHTQTALRFILEGDSAYTVVDGERTNMHEGDFIITPSWTWHDHGNSGHQPAIWLDGLDIPLTNFLGAAFAEDLGVEQQPISRPIGDSLARYGSGLLPVDASTTVHTSPVFNYSYQRTRETLEQLRSAEEWDPCHGIKLRYVNPVTGDYAISTIGAFIQLLPKGFSGASYRSTDATVFCVAEGSGKTVIGSETIPWTKRDIFVLPSWLEHRHCAQDDAVLFSFSDRPVQQKLGLWREVRATET